jgi:hypothetical protein
VPCERSSRPAGGAAGELRERAASNRSLADYVQVRGASFEGRLLEIELEREVHDAMKPRRIAITTGNDNQKIEHKKVA